MRFSTYSILYEKWSKSFQYKIYYRLTSALFISYIIQNMKSSEAVSQFCLIKDKTESMKKLSYYSSNILNEDKSFMRFLNDIYR